MWRRRTTTIGSLWRRRAHARFCKFNCDSGSRATRTWIATAGRRKRRREEEREGELLDADHFNEMKDACLHIHTNAHAHCVILFRKALAVEFQCDIKRLSLLSLSPLLFSLISSSSLSLSHTTHTHTHTTLHSLSPLLHLSLSSLSLFSLSLSFSSAKLMCESVLLYPDVLCMLTIAAMQRGKVATCQCNAQLKPRFKLWTPDLLTQHHSINS